MLTKILIMRVGIIMALGLLNDSSPMASSILMPIAPAPSKSFATLSNLDLDATNVAWELLRARLI
jgi:hypothetical protein